MTKYLIIHYDEIGIKGKNRNRFENQLISNIRVALKGLATKVYKRYGLVVVTFSGDQQIVEDKMRLIPGIAHFSFPACAKLDIEDIKQKSLEVMSNRDEQTFKIKTKRSYKKFPLMSLEVNTQVGKHIETNSDKTVDLKNHDILLKIEIGEKEAFIYSKRIGGIGGLPVGSGEKVICSLSGGLDSPVAAFEIMKRGSKVIFVHIYNNTLVKDQIVTKIKKLVEKLNSIQLSSKLYVVPFSDIQKEIISSIPSEYRMIIYRRYMLRIINTIARTEKAKAVVTGDSLGQVASQTIDNLSCIWSASSIPVLPPLIAFNKDDIIKISKKINTYETSILPYPDCCSFMIAKHPETKGKLKEIEQLEELIKDDDLVNKCIQKGTLFKT